jgi:hypothetical protein
VVALTGQDHRFGRGYREGWTTIGVISTGSCLLFGHGPGPSTIMTGPSSAFRLAADRDSNLASLLGPVREAIVRETADREAAIREPAIREIVSQEKA